MTSEDGPRVSTRLELIEQRFGKRDIKGTPLQSTDYWKGIHDTLPDQLTQDGASFTSLVKDVLLPVCEILMLGEEAEPKAAEIRAELLGLIQAVDRLTERINGLNPVIRCSLVADVMSKPGAEEESDPLYVLGEYLAVTRHRAGCELEWRFARPQSGRKRGLFRESYMTLLICGWEKHTGMSSGYTYDDNAIGENRYKGAFLDFAEAVLKPWFGSAFRRRHLIEWRKHTRHKQLKEAWLNLEQRNTGCEETT